MGANAQRRKLNRSDWTDRLKAQREAGGGGGILGGGGPKPPFCPMLSQYIVAGASPIALPGGQQASQLNLELVKVPCAALGKDCILWDEEWDCCGLRSTMEMMADLHSEGVDDGEQIPNDGPGPLPDGYQADGGPAPGAPVPPAGG